MTINERISQLDIDEKIANMMREFVALMPADFDPSIFPGGLEGSVELIWEDANGYSICVDFFSGVIEYYIRSTGEEGILSRSEIETLARRVRDI